MDRWCPRERRMGPWVKASSWGRTFKLCLSCRTPTTKGSPAQPRNKGQDQRWSRDVRARDGAICRCCAEPATDGAHIFAKGPHPSMRHRRDNGVALCRGCHQHFTSHPAQWRAWLSVHLPELYAQLQELAR